MAFNSALASRLRGNKLELSIEDRSGRVTNFYAVEQDLVDAAKEAFRRVGARTKGLAYEYCPKDTYFMANHIELVESEESQVFEVGWWASDFYEAGLPFYPEFVVLGTRYVPPNDPLTPAYEATKPEYELEMRELWRASLERRAVRSGL